MRIAAVTARKGRRIILSTGHGATEVGNNPAAFDTVPESGRMKTHKHMIISDVFDLPDIAARTPRGWVAKLPPGVRSDSATQAKVDALAPQFDMLERIGRILKQQGVRQFIVLSCRVGAGSAFGSQLAGRLQTSVGLYRDLVVMRDVVFDGPRALKVQAFTVPPDERANADRFAPDPSDRDHRSFSEIPSGASTFSP